MVRPESGCQPLVGHVSGAETGPLGLLGTQDLLKRATHMKPPTAIDGRINGRQPVSLCQRASVAQGSVSRR